jgi:hypothetical protein
MGYVLKLVKERIAKAKNGFIQSVRLDWEEMKLRDFFGVATDFIFT